MKVEFEAPTITRSADFEEHLFGISNISIIIEILRSKMYSNPIKTICQEIPSNARDAHREVGKDNLPIAIKLPNHIEPYLAVRDFGPGITPDRMLNVFIKYAASTKRETDTQTGGFGLGAKSPWAYGDSFNIVSITPENSKMIKRQYVAYIDETRIGKLARVSEEETEEPQGTTISIAVKPQDIPEFKRWVNVACRFWDIKPDISGTDDFEWELSKCILSGTKWRVFETLGYNSKMTVSIDGIPYEMDANSVFKGVEEYDYRIMNMPILLEFNTSEISVTANREGIDYNAKSIRNVKDRIAIFNKEIKDKIAEELKGCKTFTEATILFAKLNHKFCDIVKSSEWNGITLTPFLAVPSYCTVYSFKKGNYYDGIYQGKKYNISNIYPADDRLLVIDDTGRINPDRSRIATLFDNNPKIDDINVLIMDKITDPTIIKNRDESWKKHHFDLLEFVKMSTVAKKKNPSTGKTYNYGYKPIKAFKWNGSRDWVEADIDMEEDDGYYVEIFHKKIVQSLNGEPSREYYTSSMNEILKELGIKELYGIPIRFAKKMGSGWINLIDFIRVKVEEKKKDKDFCQKIGEYLAGYISKNVDYDNISILKTLNDIFSKPANKKLIASDSCPIFELISHFETSQELEKLYSAWKNIFNFVDHNIDDELKNYAKDVKDNTAKLVKEIQKKYSLLFVGSYYNSYSLDNKDTIKEMAIYINTKDKMEEETPGKQEK